MLEESNYCGMLPQRLYEFSDSLLRSQQPLSREMVQESSRRSRVSEGSDQYQYKHRYLRKRKSHCNWSPSKQGKKKKPSREVKGSLSIKEVENSIFQFQRMMYLQKVYIHEEVLKNQYPHSAQRKSLKYLIHLWYNLIHQNQQENFKEFCEMIAIPEITKTLHDRYKNRTKSVIKKLNSQIHRVYDYLLNYDGNIEQTINNIYENNHQHKKKQVEASQCLNSLKKMFIAPRSSQGQFKPQLI